MEWIFKSDTIWNDARIPELLRRPLAKLLTKTPKKRPSAQKMLDDEGVAILIDYLESL